MTGSPEWGWGNRILRKLVSPESLVLEVLEKFKVKHSGCGERFPGEQHQLPSWVPARPLHPLGSGPSISWVSTKVRGQKQNKTTTTTKKTHTGLADFMSISRIG